jgi:hypothetical protein
MNRITVSTKRFIRRHRKGIVMGGVAVAIIAMQSNQLKSQVAFMDEKGVLDEYIKTVINS